MKTVKTRSWPMFALAAVLAVLAVAVLDSPFAGVASLGAFLTFFAAALKSLGAQRKQDPERVGRLGAAGMIGGM